jgi:hypothetical protein
MDFNKTFLMWLGILSVEEKYDFSPLKQSTNLSKGGSNDNQRILM